MWVSKIIINYIGERVHLCESYNRIFQKWMEHESVKGILLLLFSHSVVFDSLQPQGLQYTRPPCPSPSPEVCPRNECFPGNCTLIQKFSLNI